MNDINKMPPVCAYCPYWEVCKPPYICASREDKKPDLQPTCNQVATDTISRQALCEYALNQKDKNITANDIMRFPSAQSERKRGKWEYYEDRTPVWDIAGEKTWARAYKCSECGFVHTVIEDIGGYGFCPHCGAKMRYSLSRQGCGVDPRRGGEQR